MAHLVKKQLGFRGGREGTLSLMGSLMLWLGLIGGIVTAFVGVVSRHVDTTACVISGIVIALNAIVANALLQGFAEVIRLLKKQDGMEYGGWIESAEPVHGYVCSKCGQSNDNDYLMCWNCKEIFDVEIRDNPD